MGWIWSHDQRFLSVLCVFVSGSLVDCGGAERSFFAHCFCTGAGVSAGQVEGGREGGAGVSAGQVVHVVKPPPRRECVVCLKPQTC